MPVAGRATLLDDIEFEQVVQVVVDRGPADARLPDKLTDGEVTAPFCDEDAE